jgi:hypothetical protein
MDHLSKASTLAPKSITVLRQFEPRSENYAMKLRDCLIGILGSVLSSDAPTNIGASPKFKKKYIETATSHERNLSITHLAIEEQPRSRKITTPSPISISISGSDVKVKFMLCFSSDLMSDIRLPT